MAAEASEQQARERRKWERFKGAPFRGSAACPAAPRREGPASRSARGFSAKPPSHKRALGSCRKPELLTEEPPPRGRCSPGSAACSQLLPAPHGAGPCFPGLHFYAQSSRVVQATGAPRPVRAAFPHPSVAHLVSRLHQAQSGFSTEVSCLDDISLTA